MILNNEIILDNQCENYSLSWRERWRQRSLSFIPRDELINVNDQANLREAGRAYHSSDDVIYYIHVVRK